MKILDVTDGITHGQHAYEFYEKRSNTGAHLCVQENHKCWLAYRDCLLANDAQCMTHEQALEWLKKQP